MKIHVHVYIYTYVCAFASPVGLALWEFHVKKAFLYPICYPSLEAFSLPSQWLLFFRVLFFSSLFLFLLLSRVYYIIFGYGLFALPADVDLDRTLLFLVVRLKLDVLSSRNGSWESFFYCVIFHGILQVTTVFQDQKQRTFWGTNTT